MTLTISELREWFRSERFGATYNALYQIMIEGAHSDTLDAATLLLARIRMNTGNVDAAILQLAHASMSSVEDAASRHALMALGVAHRAYVLQSGYITHSGSAEELKQDESIIEAYLGG